MVVLLNEEEEMVKNAAREFLGGECPPSLARAMEVDDLGYPPELWPRRTWKSLLAGSAM